MLGWFFLGVISPPGGTHISEVEGNFQVVPEQVREVGVHVQHLQQVISEDLVKVAVGQSPDVSVGFPRPPEQVDGFTKDVVFSYIRRAGGGGGGGEKCRQRGDATLFPETVLKETTFAAWMRLLQLSMINAAVEWKWNTAQAPLAVGCTGQRQCVAACV